MNLIRNSFDEPLPEHANTQSIRVAGGLGTVARIVADGEEIYRDRLTLRAVLARIDQLYFPFHAQLARLIDETVQRFGYAVLIDCHSMPSSAMTPGGGPRPDIVIGDRFGASADPRLSQLVRDALHRPWLRRADEPALCGRLHHRAPRPAGARRPRLQIEINRGLYLNETTLQENAGYARLQSDLAALAAHLFATVPALFELRDGS